MINTTLCYLKKDGKYLMLYRNKKPDDINGGKYIGIGGKFEKGETPDECLIREVREETGVTLTSYHFFGTVDFYCDDYSEKMYLYSADGWDGEIGECDEGELLWVEENEVLKLPLWEGDRYFLEPMIKGDNSRINMGLYYKNNKLRKVEKYMNICVYGAASKRVSEDYVVKTELLGEKLAERGHTVIFGGGASGMMGAVARGAHRKKGKVIGIAPEFFNNRKLFSPYCTEFHLTENMRDRKQMLEDMSDAFIVSPGGIGTLDEFFEIFTVRNLARHVKAIVIYNVNGFFDGILKFLEDVVIAEGFAKPKIMDCIKVLDDPDEVIDFIENYVGEVVDVADAKEV